jgi:hypothetical protein
MDTAYDKWCHNCIYEHDCETKEEFAIRFDTVEIANNLLDVGVPRVYQWTNSERGFDLNASVTAIPENRPYRPLTLICHNYCYVVPRLPKKHPKREPSPIKEEPKKQSSYQVVEVEHLTFKDLKPLITLRHLDGSLSTADGVKLPRIKAIRLDGSTSMVDDAHAPGSAAITVHHGL